MKTKKILHLTLKKEWFDLIAAGIKTVEYREMKLYWFKRLVRPDYLDLMDPDSFIKFDEVHFRNGYTPNCPFMRLEHLKTTICPPKLITYKGGSKLHVSCSYAIELGAILEIKNHKL